MKGVRLAQVEGNPKPSRVCRADLISASICSHTLGCADWLRARKCLSYGVRRWFVWNDTEYVRCEIA